MIQNAPVEINIDFSCEMKNVEIRFGKNDVRCI